MRTKQQIEDDMSKAEVEIKKILNKYDFKMYCKYDDEICIVMSHVQQHPTGGYYVIETETDIQEH